MAATLYPLASLSQVEKTPSRDDGIPEDLEEDLRAYGCKLIHQAGILLNQYARADGFPDVRLKLGGLQETGCCGRSSNTFSKVLVCNIYETIWCRGASYYNTKT